MIKKSLTIVARSLTPDSLLEYVSSSLKNAFDWTSAYDYLPIGSVNYIQLEDFLNLLERKNLLKICYINWK
jgi:hypothetical protein